MYWKLMHYDRVVGVFQLDHSVVQTIDPGPYVFCEISLSEFIQYSDTNFDGELVAIPLAVKQEDPFAHIED